MKDSVLDLLCTSLIPKLCSDISAGTPCNKEGVLVTVATVRTFPDQFAVVVCNYLDLSVVAALFTIVALGVKLGVENVVIYESHNFQNCINIVLKVRHLNVAYGTAR